MYANTVPDVTVTEEKRPYTPKPVGRVAAVKLSPASAVALTTESTKGTITRYSSPATGVNEEVIRLKPFCPNDCRK